MNDFTKDELESIWNWGDVYCWDSHVSETVYRPLLDKLQSLIENYCEHEWRCWDDEYNSRECLKCGEERQGEIKDE